MNNRLYDRVCEQYGEPVVYATEGKTRKRWFVWPESWSSKYVDIPNSAVDGWSLDEALKALLKGKEA